MIPMISAGRLSAKKLKALPTSVAFCVASLTVKSVPELLTMVEIPGTMPASAAMMIRIIPVLMKPLRDILQSLADNDQLKSGEPIAVALLRIRE